MYSIEALAQAYTECMQEMRPRWTHYIKHAALYFDLNSASISTEQLVSVMLNFLCGCGVGAHASLEHMRLPVPNL